MAANYMQTVAVNLDINQLAMLLRDPGFAAALGLKFQSEEPQHGGALFRYNKGITMLSYGERILITVMPAAVNSVNVTIRSECVMPTQIVDWGANKNNVMAVINYISANAYRYQPVRQPQQPAPQPAAQQGGFCPKCGAPAKGAFCAYCGTRIG